ncbi:MAG: ATP-binding protein [Chloroflexi bacterium]|nr:ATP-binding protein [Chloroflexota bacterium]
MEFCVSLPHRGVLFQDELPELGHYVLEVLRQLLENSVVPINWASSNVT